MLLGTLFMLILIYISVLAIANIEGQIQEAQ